MGEEDGKGIFTYSNGEKYEGEYKNGKRTGRENFFLKMGINMKVSFGMV